MVVADYIRENLDLIKCCDVKGDDLVLDVGCRFCSYYREESGYRLVGLDASSKILKFAYFDPIRGRRKYESLSPIVGDVYHLPFRDNRFDAVISRRTMFWLENPMEAIKEMIRVLKPENKLAIMPDSTTFLYPKISHMLKILGIHGITTEGEYVYGTKQA